MFRHNLVVDNNNLTVPATALVAGAPWGVGLEWPGVYGDLVSDNTIRGNVNFGILAFEAPNPYPARGEHDLLPDLGQPLRAQHARR